MHEATNEIPVVIIWISIAGFAGVVLFLVLIRGWLGEKFSISTTDLLFGLVPIVIWLLLSGKITKFEYGGLKFETVFIEAKQSSISSEVTKLPIEGISSTRKAGIGQIDYIVSLQKEGVIFLSGYSNYAGAAIREYLVKLRNSSVKYFIFQYDSDAQFIGIISFDNLYIQALQGYSPTAPPEKIAEWLKKNDVASLLQIKGMISRSHALMSESTKQQALEKMETIKSDFLPIIDEQNKFVGVVTSSRVSTSLLADISRRLEGKR